MKLGKIVFHVSTFRRKVFLSLRFLACLNGVHPLMLFGQKPLSGCVHTRTMHNLSIATPRLDETVPLHWFGSPAVVMLCGMALEFFHAVL